MEINVRSLVLVLVLISSAVVALACGSTENPAPEANLGVSPTSGDASPPPPDDLPSDIPGDASPPPPDDLPSDTPGDASPPPPPTGDLPAGAPGDAPPPPPPGDLPAGAPGDAPPPPPPPDSPNNGNQSEGSRSSINDCLQISKPKSANSAQGVNAYGYLYGYDQDVWQFSAKEGDKALIEMIGSVIPRAQRNRMDSPLTRTNALAETIFSIVDPNGKEIITNHKGTEFLPEGQANHPIQFSICTTGVHKIYANTYKNDSGGYQLAVSLNNVSLQVTPAEDGNTPLLDQNPIAITQGNKTTNWTYKNKGSFFIEDKQDTYTFNASKGQLLKVLLKVVAPFKYGKDNFDFNTQLHLFDSKGKIIEVATDVGAGMNPILITELPMAGQYSLVSSIRGKFALPNEGKIGNDAWNQWDASTNQLFDLGPNGLGHYEIQFSIDLDGTHVRQEFPLKRKDAVKINAIRVTDDVSFSSSNPTKIDIQAQVDHLNKIYGDLLPIGIWPGFELASITDYYDPVRAKSSTPEEALMVMDEVGASPAAIDDAVNIILTDINNAGTQGYTYKNFPYRARKGAQIVVDTSNISGGASIDPYSASILLHEMAHVTGIDHFAGFAVPQRVGIEVSEEMGTYDYVSFLYSNAEKSFMSQHVSEASKHDSQYAGQSWYLTRPEFSLNTPTYGRVVRASFINWLVKNEIVELSTIPTQYLLPKLSVDAVDSKANWEWDEQNDIKLTTMETPKFPLIVSADSPLNQSAAAAWTSSTQDEIWLVNRDQNGSWASPVSFVYPDGVSALSIKMNNSGNAIAIWERSKAKNLGNSSIEITTYDVSTKTWAAPSPLSALSDTNTSMKYPRLEINDNGEATAIWVRRNSGSQQGKYQLMSRTRDTQGAWSSSIVLSESSNLIAFPALSLNQRGDKWVAWQEFLPNKKVFQVKGRFFSNETATYPYWSATEIYSDGTAHAGFPQLSLDSQGNGIMYWREADQAKLIASHHFIGTTQLNGYLSMSATAHLTVMNRARAGRLSSKKQLSDQGHDSFNANVETAEDINIKFTANGKAIAVWYGFDGDDYRIFASSRDALGNWGSAKALSASGYHAKTPRIAIADNGEVAIIWGRSDPVAGHVIETASLDPESENWSSPLVLSKSNQTAVWADISFDGGRSYTAIWVELEKKQKSWDPDKFFVVTRSGKTN